MGEGPLRTAIIAARANNYDEKAPVCAAGPSFAIALCDDMVTSTRFADAMKNGIQGSELVVFESCSNAPIYESVSEFNQKTLSFLSRYTG